MTFLATPLFASILTSAAGAAAGGLITSLLTPRPKTPKPIQPKPPPTQLTAGAATQKAGLVARSRLGGAGGVNVGLLGGGSATARASLLGA